MYACTCVCIHVCLRVCLHVSIIDASMYASMHGCMYAPQPLSKCANMKKHANWKKEGKGASMAGVPKNLKTGNSMYNTMGADSAWFRACVHGGGNATVIDAPCSCLPAPPPPPPTHTHKHTHKHTHAQPSVPIKTGICLHSLRMYNMQSDMIPQLSVVFSMTFH